MGTRPHSDDEMSFREFKEMFATLTQWAGRHDFECARAMKAFNAVLESGCSETEAKRWLLSHVSDFPEELRNHLMLRFAEETLQDAERDTVHGMTDEEVHDRFMVIWNRDGLDAARAWLRKARAS